MPLKWFICPDGQRIEYGECLKEGGCRMGDRCAARSYLYLCAQERPWTGKPSCTQLIQGTMAAFLKITKDYAISPDSRAFAINGTKAHKNLENAGAEDEMSELEMKFVDGDISGIADAIETECGRVILSDNKTSGSYKIQKALGIVQYDELTGEVYKTGPRKGEPKTRKMLKRDNEAIDRWEWELQLNFYRVQYDDGVRKKIKELEAAGEVVPPSLRIVDELRLMSIVRDGNTTVARNRGIVRNVYYFRLPIMDDKEVREYFKTKKEALFKALKQGFWDEVCNAKENWDGRKCQNYCEVAEHCRFGKYLARERETEDMVIKGLSEIRRMPRLGKIRLGIKKQKFDSKGDPVIRDGKPVEYPAEIDYFKLDPQTPIEEENKKMIEVFQKLYGKEPKSIKIMFPVEDTAIFFPQFYKWYGGATLKCKGDGEVAVCAKEEFAKGLKVIGKDDMGLPKVVCAGKQCPNYSPRGCTEVGVLQVLLPELPGAGVWQITTGSFHNIVNLNSSIEMIRAMTGRISMIPLTLERREQSIVHDGQARNHYIMHVNMACTLAELQKMAQIDPTKALLELPGADPDPDALDVPTPPDALPSPMDQVETVVGEGGVVETVDKRTGEMTAAEEKKPAAATGGGSAGPVGDGRKELATEIHEGLKSRGLLDKKASNDMPVELGLINEVKAGATKYSDLTLAELEKLKGWLEKAKWNIDSIIIPFA